MSCRNEECVRKNKEGSKGVRHHEEQDDSCCGKIKEAGTNENETNVVEGTESDGERL